MLGLVALLPASAQGGGGDDASGSFEQVLVEPAQRRAVDRALAWLAANQRPGGMWGEESGTCVADTALAVLALMAGGNTVCAGKPLETGLPGKETLRGPYADQVRKGLRYLARRGLTEKAGKATGYIEGDKHSRMHGHGFATLALAEASGNLAPSDIETIRRIARSDVSSLSLGDEVRWALELAVRCTETSQDRDTGGWWYTPGESGHEGSMTVTQITALRAASNAGVRVNGDVIRKAYDYVRSSQNLVMREQYGGFAYMKSRLERVSYGLTAAALTTFFGLGRYGGEASDRKVIDLGLTYMDGHLQRYLEPETQWFYYNLFYGAQALYLSGDQRRIADQWPRIRKAVMDQQLEDGSFRDTEAHKDTGGVEYSTAIACLTLQVPMETLPIFQRR